MTRQELKEKCSLETQRDELGLLPNVNYIIKDDCSSIDWRKMIPKEFIVPNMDRLKNADQESIDIDKLNDSQLLLLLGGIKEVAHLRGFQSVKYEIYSASMDSAIIACHIQWVPNFESNFLPVSYTGLGEAHLNNTKSFGKDFLVSIAENRAFIRCVRNFLRIHIVGKDELGCSEKETCKTTQEVSSSDIKPLDILKKLMDKHGVNFQALKDIIRDDSNANLLEKIPSIDDLNKKLIILSIEKLKSVKK